MERTALFIAGFIVGGYCGVKLGYAAGHFRGAIFGMDRMFKIRLAERKARWEAGF